jgi:hypothetical protein
MTPLSLLLSKAYLKLLRIVERLAADALSLWAIGIAGSVSARASQESCDYSA